MPSPMQDLIAEFEIRLVNTVERLNEAELKLYYTEVLELEERVERLHDTLAFVADRIAIEGVASS
ncbi:MAG: hypothetical protein M3357_13940 [Actinomycetota bacterium]|nr:hypothetical protein [Actinomycetota bacterium]